MTRPSRPAPNPTSTSGPRPTRRGSRWLVVLGAAKAAAVAGVVAVPSAYAAPVPVEDNYTVYAGGTYTLSPVANDEKSLLTFGDLTLCGVASSDARVVYIEQVDQTLVVEVRRGASGSTVIQYDVCQGTDRRTGTINLAVTKPVDLRAAKKAGVKGQVVFTNDNAVPVKVVYGSASSGKPDSTREVPAQSSVTVNTVRSSFYWVAELTDDTATVPAIPAGDATILSVQSRK